MRDEKENSYHNKADRQRSLNTKLTVLVDGKQLGTDGHVQGWITLTTAHTINSQYPAHTAHG